MNLSLNPSFEKFEFNQWKLYIWNFKKLRNFIRKYIRVYIDVDNVAN